MTYPLLPIPPQEIGEYARSLFGSNIREMERASTIFAVAALEVALEAAIRKLLLDEARPTEEMLRADGPLGSLRAKILMARLLDLVDAPTARALDIARKIRNDFAHATEAMTLDNPPNRERLLELEKLTHAGGFLPMFAEWLQASPPSRRQLGFCVSIAILTKLLDKSATLNTHVLPAARVRLVHSA